MSLFDKLPSIKAAHDEAAESDRLSRRISEVFEKGLPIPDNWDEPVEGVEGQSPYSSAGSTPPRVPTIGRNELYQAWRKAKAQEPEPNIILNPLQYQQIQAMQEKIEIEAWKQDVRDAVALRVRQKMTLYSTPNTFGPAVQTCKATIDMPDGTRGVCSVAHDTRSTNGDTKREKELIIQKAEEQFVKKIEEEIWGTPQSPKAIGEKMAEGVNAWLGKNFENLFKNNPTFEKLKKGGHATITGTPAGPSPFYAPLAAGTFTVLDEPTIVETPMTHQSIEEAAERATWHVTYAQYKEWALGRVKANLGLLNPEKDVSGIGCWPVGIEPPLLPGGITVTSKAAHAAKKGHWDALEVSPSHGMVHVRDEEPWWPALLEQPHVDIVPEDA